MDWKKHYLNNVKRRIIRRLGDDNTPEVRKAVTEALQEAYDKGHTNGKTAEYNFHFGYKST